MAKRKVGICTYCGKEKHLGKDHVFPKTLFVTLDRQMVTVPCCSDCNHEKSLGDKDLKIFVNLHAAGGDHPDAILHVDRILRKGGPTADWLAHSVDSARPAEIKTRAGIVVGQGVEFPFNRSRMTKTLQMVVRGLLFHEVGTRLGPALEVSVWEIPPGDVSFTLRAFEVFSPNVNRTLGNRVAFSGSAGRTSPV